MVLNSSSNVPRTFGYVLVDRKDYQIVDNWNVFGMQGTGSRRVVIEDLFIPSHRMMELAEIGPTGTRLLRNQPGRSLHTNPMYHGQILPFLMFELISVVLGAARGALDVYDQILKDKKAKMPPFSPLFEMPDAQRRFGEAQGLIDTAEAALLMLASNYMEVCRREYVDNVVFNEEAARGMHRAQQQCVELSWRAVDLMFRSGGTSSATKSALLGRYFRNLAVIRTHILLQIDQTSINLGRLHFGLPPLTPH